ncbi:PqqD family peptide modification chaperone [Streptomyces sp. TRM70308]|uniref:PqqD family peptide modification chaperone n=1 Tax=Streptomyces TaxID=1883 RepID=UPI0022498C88|nr:PqqD family peptide modification chaperone [Streptomyces sp. JHD 1]MCX2968744.1 PqqD family peptide modification chaperone [Streptomyces sp. JHD 1]
MPGVCVASVDADGCLELLAESAAFPGFSGRYWCGPVGTAMWIALLRHDGDAEAAASSLAEIWRTAPENARADLEIWIEEMRDAGLMCARPAP